MLNQEEKLRYREIAEQFLKEYRGVSNSDIEILSSKLSAKENSDYEGLVQSIHELEDGTTLVSDAIEKSKLKREYIEAKHNMFVEMCLRPRGFLGEEHEVYAYMMKKRVLVDGGSKAERYEYTISLVTPAMAYTDYRYFMELNEESDDKPWWYDEYRPYYYELTLTIPNSDKEWQEFYEFHSDGSWFKTEIYDWKSCDPKDYKCGLLRYGGSDPETYIIGIRLKQDAKNDKYTKKKDRPQLMDDLRKLYLDSVANATIKDLETFLDGVLTANDDYDVDILNVGEANCVHVKGINGPSFIFDIGIPFDSYEDPNNKGSYIPNPDYLTSSKGSVNFCIGAIKKYKPMFIIVSHWHYDHCAGFIHMCDAGLRTHWIMPGIIDKVNCASCYRLALFAMGHNSLTFINIDAEKEVDPLYNKNGIELWRGNQECDGDGLLDLNSISVMLRIRNVFLSADCLYRNWPENLQNQASGIAVLVVPHHGCELKSSDYTVTSKLNNGAKKGAVFSVGNSKYYTHPSQTHITELKNQGFEYIYATGGSISSLPFKGVTHDISLVNNRVHIEIRGNKNKISSPAGNI